MVQLTVTQSDKIHSDEAKERKQGKESAHLVSLYDIQISRTADHLSSKVIIIYIWPEKKGIAFGGRGTEGKEKRRKRKKPYLNHKAHSNKLRAYP